MIGVSRVFFEGGGWGKGEGEGSLTYWLLGPVAVNVNTLNSG